MRKLIITGMAVAMLAIPSVASADVTNNPSLSVNGCTTYPDWVLYQDAFGPISNNAKK